MNYTLKQLKDSINNLIEQQGEDAHCAAWIYTKEDCYLIDQDDNMEYPALHNPELAERIFADVGNIDYIYQTIQECVDESTEEQLMLQQQELINNVIDGMDFKTMWSVLDDYMHESYSKYTDEELMEEVKEYYPELLEEN